MTTTTSLAWDADNGFYRRQAVQVAAVEAAPVVTDPAEIELSVRDMSSQSLYVYVRQAQWADDWREAMRREISHRETAAQPIDWRA
jgi:hypothetical protein